MKVHFLYLQERLWVIYLIRIKHHEETYFFLDLPIWEVDEVSNLFEALWV